MEKALLRLTFSACVIIGGFVINSNTSGGFTSDLTGSPISSSTCQTSCHNSFPLNSGPGSVSMNVPSNYYPGSTYNVSLTVNASTPKFGFMAGVLRDDNSNGGTISNGTGSSAITILGRSYTRHNSANFNGTWNFDWTAPSFLDTVSFHFVGIAANNAQGNNGDNVYTSSVTIFPLDTIDFTESITDASCFGNCDGAISLSGVIGGEGAPFSYNWSTGATTSNVTSLCSGSYTVTVTDVGGNDAERTFTIGEPSAIVSNIGANGTTCAGGNGDVGVAPSGGVSPYSFNWSNGAITDSILGVSIGSYIVTITDANGCIAVDTAEVVEAGSGLLANFTEVLANCGGADGSLTINMTTGTAPYSYSWSTGSTTAGISNVSSATYTVTVTDNAGCQEVFSETLGENNVVIDENGSTLQSAACNGEASGSIEVSVSEGLAPFVYDWSNGATSNPASGLSAGTYTVTLTDQAGCTSEASFSISEPSLLEAEATVTNAIESACNGVISIAASGGTGPLTYAWSHNAMAMGNLQGDLCPGDYEITVADANNCTTEVTTTVFDALGIPMLSGIEMRIFPNPAQSMVYLEGDLSEVVAVTVVDMTGGIVKEINTGIASGIDVNDLPTGRYNLLIENREGFILRPLMIQR